MIRSETELIDGLEFSLVSTYDFEAIESIKLLGRGAFASVKLVKYRPTNELLTLKSVSKQFLRSIGKKHYAQKEKLILEHLEDLRIVKLKGYFEDNESYHFLMEYIPMGELLNYLEERGEEVTKEEIRFIVCQLLDMIEFCHSKGIIHKDLKPENVMIDQQRNLKLIDFGTAECFVVDKISGELLQNLKELKNKNQSQFNAFDSISKEDKDRQVFNDSFKQELTRNLGESDMGMQVYSKNQNEENSSDFKGFEDNLPVINIQIKHIEFTAENSTEKIKEEEKINVDLWETDKINELDDKLLSDFCKQKKSWESYVNKNKEEKSENQKHQEKIIKTIICKEILVDLIEVIFARSNKSDIWPLDSDSKELNKYSQSKMPEPLCSNLCKTSTDLGIEECPVLLLVKNTSSKKRNSGLVGTIIYMSPEMLAEETVTYSTDLWSLGVILFKLITGRNLSFDQFDFTQIQSCVDQEVNNSPQIEKAEQELLKVLLSVDKQQRGVTCQPNSAPVYKHLKSLKYFEGVEWSRIRTGESDLDFSQSKALLELSEAHRRTFFTSLMSKTQTVLVSGLVRKYKYRFFYNTRQLVLYKGSLLVYLDPSTSEKKGSIDLRGMVEAGCQNRSKFWVQMPDRRYVFESLEYPAAEWVYHISSCAETKSEFNFG